MRLRRTRDVEGLEPRERVLATATGPDGRVVATTYRLMLPSAAGAAVEWGKVETATWDGDERVLAVAEVAGPSGRHRRHSVVIDEPGRLVDVVREQVTASVIISRHIVVDGRRGVRVTGRRTPQDEIVWSAVLDPGVDMDDPATRERVQAAVALVRGEVE